MKKLMRRKLLMGLTTSFALALAFSGMALEISSAESECALTMRAGASVRIGGSNGTGIRFTANVDENLLSISEDMVAWSATDSVTEVGMIIVPSFVLAGVGESDVFSYLKTNYGAEKSEISTQFTDAQIQKDKDGYYVAGAIVSIKDENLAETYQAIPYTYDGANYVYGKASDERTISYVFNAALNATATTEEEKATKASVIAKVIEMNDKLDIKTELSVADGGDLSGYIVDGYAISSVKLGDTDITELVEDGKIAANRLDLTSAAKDEQSLVLTYADDKGTLNVNAQVWSLLIDEESDFNKMKSYSYKVAKTASVNAGISSNAIYGYYKITSDLNMSDSKYVINGNYMLASSNECANYKDFGFQGVIDGDGHTVDNITVSHRSIIGVMGGNAVVKNVNFTNVSYTSTIGGQQGLLASWTIGGTVENVTVTYNTPAVNHSLGTSGGYSGALLGQIYPLGDYGASKVKLTNVTIKEKDGTSTNKNFAALGMVTTTQSFTNTMSNGRYFDAENVLIVGDGIFGDNKAGVIVKEYGGVTYYGSEEEYVNAATSLSAIEVEVGDTVDFASLVKGTVKSVTLNGVVLDSTRVQYTAEHASDVAKMYLIETTDGRLYKQSVTVWSMLIENESELASMKDNVVIEPVAVAGSTSYKFTGYFKLVNDIPYNDSWTSSLSVAPYSNSLATEGKAYYHTLCGFQGVFDGNGKTIEGLAFQGGNSSIFGVIGKNAVIKNVTFTNVTYSGSSGLIALWALGGTISDVTVSYEVPESLTTASGAGVLFGNTYMAGNGYNTTITLMDVQLVATRTGGSTNADFTALGCVRTANAPNPLFTCTNVSITDTRNQTTSNYNTPIYVRAQGGNTTIYELEGVEYTTAS